MNGMHPRMSGGSGGRQPLLLRADEVARLVAVSTRTLWRLVNTEQFPAPVRVGGCTRWRLADVENWVNRCRSGTRTNTLRIDDPHGSAGN
jgi:predicted DNA-binding transcriptional regulator AlpA